MRVNKELTQTEVAKELGISLKQYRLKESGKKELWLREAIALKKLFGVELNDFE